MYKIFRPIHAISTNLRRCVIPARQSSYIVLLPEDPVDSKDDNPLLRIADGELPNFPEITEKKCFTGVGRLALDYETGVWEIEEKIRADPSSITFDNLIEPLDVLDSQLSVGWSTAKILYTARQDIMGQKTYLGLHDRARKARVHKFKSLPIYNICKALNSKTEDLTDCQRRILRKFLLESRLNGIELSPVKAEGFVNHSYHLNKFKTEYKQKIMVSSNRFAYGISDPATVKGFPPDLLKKMAVNGDSTRGPWTVTLKPDVYEDFIAYCPARQLRWNAYQAYNMRGSKRFDSELDNSVNIEEIRSGRLRQAKMLGYENFASMSMETKMAGSVENVFSMISTLMSSAVPRQHEEMTSLAEFAHSQGFTEDALQGYDVPYFSRLQKEHLYKDVADLSPYLPFEHVLVTLLQLCSQLFGIQFEEIGSGPELNTWHPSVRFFNVLDNDGSSIASFYLDPYKRPDKLNVLGNSSWVISQRSRSTINPHPVATIVCNFSPPGQHQSLLSLSDVTTLFGKFGELLQHVLTTVPYVEAAGLTNIEWDAVQTCQHFMANWVYVPAVLKSLTQHHETGASLAPEQVHDAIKASNHMAGHKLSKHLYLANLDMLLHTTPEFWKQIVATLWPQFMPYQLDKNNEHICSFTESLTDVWAAAYYSHTWSRVLAADCTQAFLEADQEEDWPELGKRFRSTFLALGGGRHPAEVFRQFRGRDPSPELLTQLYGISETENVP